MLSRLAILVSLILVWGAGLHGTAIASSVTLYSGNYTGKDLNDLVTQGKALYPNEIPSLTGTRLDFPAGQENAIIYRLPIINTGAMSGLDDLVVTMTLNWDMLSSDNDFSFAISDGSQLLGACIGDQNMYWAVNGTDSDTTFSSTWTPGGPYKRVMPITLKIDVGANSSILTLTNGEHTTFNFTLDKEFNINNQIDLILGREHSWESYGINSLSISAVAQSPSPVPIPAPVLLFGSGIGTLFCLRKTKK